MRAESGSSVEDDTQIAEMGQEEERGAIHEEDWVGRGTAEAREDDSLGLGWGRDMPEEDAQEETAEMAEERR